MVVTPIADSASSMKSVPRVRRLIVAGFSVGAAGLISFLTINCVSGVPGAVITGTSALVVLGLVLPALGMLQMARSVDPTQRTARQGLEMQAMGLVGLLIGVVLIVVLSTFSGYIVGTGFVTVFGTLALIGVVFFRRYAVSAVFLALGMILVFSGVELIADSNIAAIEYWISQVQNTVYVDVGATIAACGCVLAAYSFFVIHDNKAKMRS